MRSKVLATTDPVIPGTYAFRNRRLGACRRGDRKNEAL